MSNKFAEDIRRIAKGTRFKGPLGLYSPRDPIGEKQIALITDPLGLGGGYGDGGLNNETPTSEAPNSETEQNENEGDQNPALDPNDPNSFYKGGAGTGTDSAAGEGSFDVADIINGDKGPQTTIPGTSGGVNEISGMKDCESNTPFNLQLDGNFPVPEGWEDAETPPELPDYTPGKVWFVSDQAVAYYAATPQQLGIAVAPAIGSGQWIYASYTLTQGGGAAIILHTNTITGVTQQAIATAALIDCDDVPSVEACVNPNPGETAWPEDGIFELANKDGNLVTSDFDADAPAPYSSSGKDFCFGEDRTGRALVTADGGTMIYETNAEGAPIGTVRVYGPDGTAQGFGDATEGFISQWLPK